MGFVAINGFEQKISTGNAMQMISRDLYRITKGFDMCLLIHIPKPNGNLPYVATLPQKQILSLKITTISKEDFRKTHASSRNTKGATVRPNPVRHSRPLPARISGQPKARHLERLARHRHD